MSDTKMGCGTMFGWGLVAVLVLFTFLCFLASQSSSSGPWNEPGSEAQDLAGKSFVTHKDGSITQLSPRDAQMMLETCSALQKMKFSDMTPEMLSVWNTCLSHGIR